MFNGLHLIGLRNDEHFQFHAEFKELVAKHGAQALKIQAQFEAYLPLYEKEDEGLKKINKSALTAEIQAADKARDDIYSGMVKMNDAALKHFDSQVQEAAKRLKIVFNTYGNVAAKPLNEQTSAVTNILQDLQGKYAGDLSTAGLERWAEELKARNEVFSQLMRDRFDETTLKTDVVLKEARAQVDKAYRGITERLTALALVEGAAPYEPFARALNVVIDKYASALARRRSSKKKDVETMED